MKSRKYSQKCSTDQNVSNDQWMSSSYRLKYTDLAKHVTCLLCNCILIDATVVTECLHTFCRFCVLRHLSVLDACPVCGVQINRNKNTCNLRQDFTLQNIINKLFPDNFFNEMAKRREFYEKKPYADPELSRSMKGDVTSYIPHIYAANDKICLCLRFFDSTNSSHSSDIHLRCEVCVSLLVLAKFISIKMAVNRGLTDILFIYKGYVLPMDVALIDIGYIYGFSCVSSIELLYTFRMLTASSIESSISHKISICDFSDNISNEKFNYVNTCTHVIAESETINSLQSASLDVENNTKNSLSSNNCSSSDLSSIDFPSTDKFDKIIHNKRKRFHKRLYHTVEDRKQHKKHEKVCKRPRTYHGEHKHTDKVGYNVDLPSTTGLYENINSTNKNSTGLSDTKFDVVSTSSQVDQISGIDDQTLNSIFYDANEIKNDPNKKDLVNSSESYPNQSVYLIESKRRREKESSLDQLRDEMVSSTCVHDCSPEDLLNNSSNINISLESSGLASRESIETVGRGEEICEQSLGTESDLEERSLVMVDDVEVDECKIDISNDSGLENSNICVDIDDNMKSENIDHNIIHKISDSFQTQASHYSSSNSIKITDDMFVNSDNISINKDKFNFSKIINNNSCVERTFSDNKLKNICPNSANIRTVYFTIDQNSCDSSNIEEKSNSTVYRLLDGAKIIVSSSSRYNPDINSVDVTTASSSASNHSQHIQSIMHKALDLSTHIRKAADSTSTLSPNSVLVKSKLKKIKQARAQGTQTLHSIVSNLAQRQNISLTPVTSAMTSGKAMLIPPYVPQHNYALSYHYPHILSIPPFYPQNFSKFSSNNIRSNSVRRMYRPFTYIAKPHLLSDSSIRIPSTNNVPFSQIDTGLLYYNQCDYLSKLSNTHYRHVK